MALKALKPCPYPGCSELTRERHCQRHKREVSKMYDQQRGTALKRGYGYKWQQYRLWYLKRHPLCVECEKKGNVRQATDVDHIQPVNGPNDKLFWDTINHQGLCHSCHSSKTAKENGGFGIR